MSANPNPRIYPLYNTLLTNVLSDAFRALYFTTGRDQWTSVIKTRILVQEQTKRAEIDQYVKQVENTVAHMDCVEYMTPAETYFRKTVKKDELYEKSAIALLDKVMLALKPYLENPGIIGRNPNPKHIRQEEENQE